MKRIMIVLALFLFMNTTDSSQDACQTALQARGATNAPRLAPDGSYVIGTPVIAPNGSFVGGNPHLAPDGTYVGDGQLIPERGD